MAIVLTGMFAIAGCEGAQSALDPAGRDAERMARLFTWTAAGTLIIWAGMVVLGLYAPGARPYSERRVANVLIIGGGVALPVTVLTVLLFYGLADLPGILAPGPPGLSIEISGTQWWWRVRYLRPGQAPIELANEIHLPIGARVNTRLLSSDVVHSFWIPPIAGKMDMIPGRVNRLALEPTRTGTFRGACSEYCGTSHARMNLIVVVTRQAPFDRWLANQAQPGVIPYDPVSKRGQTAFFERGCNACHTIRGSAAVGVTGPDLTHVGSRATIAAGTLERTPAGFRRWIAGTELLKPGVHMPAFATLPDDVLTALVAYLGQLE